MADPLGSNAGAIPLYDVVYNAPVPNVTDDIPCGYDGFTCFGVITKVSETPVPEVDPAAATSALTLLLGALAVVSGRRRGARC